MNELVAWLRGVLDEAERDVREAATDEDTGIDETDLIEPAKVDLARVAAERMILFLQEIGPGALTGRAYEPEGLAVLDHVLRAIAYGHRFDAPGWREEWAPEGAKV